MDKREAREYLGTNHHFNPAMNPTSPPKDSWWNKKPTQPIMIQRQLSATSDSGSPTASPMSPSTFSYPMQKSDMMKKPKIFKSFDFTD